MKLVIFGPPGSGKTTFAQNLAAKTQLPLFHIDKHYFVAGWKKREEQAYLADLNSFLTKPEWIVEGNAMRSLEPRIKAADTVIYARPPLFTCLSGVLLRITDRNKRTDHPEGAKNSITYPLLRYLIQFRKRYDPEIKALIKKHPHVTYYEPHSREELSALADKLTLC